MQPPPLPLAAFESADVRRGLRWWRVLTSAGVGGIVGAGAWVLRTIAPTAGDFYPSCTFHALTGLHCPGCGATRCAHALLHLSFLEAAHQNLLFLCALPVLGYFGGRAWWRWLNGYPKRISTVSYPIWYNWVGIAIIFLFGILRNLPWPPFTWLAPY